MNILLLIGVFLAFAPNTNCAPFLGYAQIPKSVEQYNDNEGYFLILIDKFRQIYENVMRFDRVFNKGWSVRSPIDNAAEEKHVGEKLAYYFRHI